MYKVSYENKGNINGQASSEEKHLGQFENYQDALKFAKKQVLRYGGTGFFAKIFIRRADGTAIGSISALYEPLNMPKNKTHEYEYSVWSEHPDEPKLDKKFWYGKAY